jgi:hypothetical protein
MVRQLSAELEREAGPPAGDHHADRLISPMIASARTPHAVDAWTTALMRKRLD